MTKEDIDKAVKAIMLLRLAPPSRGMVMSNAISIKNDVMTWNMFI
ncbi:hypothetical protein [Vibrio owensii]|nr:hypothetical protein [Vibrio owensii]